MSFTALYEHIIFAPRHRISCIIPDKEEELFRYIWGTIKNKDCTLLRINAAGDHVHILLRRHQSVSTADLVADIKRASSGWIRERNLFPRFFGWAREYAAMSVSYYEVDKIRQYIMNQKEHHKRVTFEEEYRSFLSPGERKRFRMEFFDD